jgi:hypothetical protein
MSEQKGRSFPDIATHLEENPAAIQVAVEEIYSPLLRRTQMNRPPNEDAIRDRVRPFPVAAVRGCA